MIRLLLILVVLILAVVGVIAIALYHFLGWKGMIAFPFVLLVFAWIAKFIIGQVIKRFAIGLIGTKSKVLHDATLSVHSITPVPAPAKSEGAKDDDEEGGEKDSDDAAGDEPGEPGESGKPKHYYAVDLTITPRNGNSENIWEPGELILTTEKIASLSDLRDDEKTAGHAHDVQVWDGKAFGPDDPGKYPGPQRLKVTFEVAPGTSKAWVHYYNESIGTLELPPWDVG